MRRWGVRGTNTTGIIKELMRERESEEESRYNSFSLVFSAGVRRVFVGKRDTVRVTSGKCVVGVLLVCVLRFHLLGCFFADARDRHNVFIHFLEEFVAACVLI